MKSAREIARDALIRIDRDNAWVQRVVSSELEGSELETRDRAFATELIYGTTRMMRACDHLFGRFVNRKLDTDVRAVLRMGTYQIVFMGTPHHAAVGESVDVAPERAAGFVNAVLRRVAAGEVEYPNAATRLSYPNWIVDLLVKDLGDQAAFESLSAMNKPVITHPRADGYVQDKASQWVGDCVGAQAGELILDMCAAPGGKATGMARSGAKVVAAELHRGRALQMGDLIGDLELHDSVQVVCMDGREVALTGGFDRVLLDAPCSGLGALRRRADARWNTTEGAVPALSLIQKDLMASAAELVKSGGELIYSVCTLSNAESIDIDTWAAAKLPELEPVELPHSLGEKVGRNGERVLPSMHEGDGMTVFRYRRT